MEEQANIHASAARAAFARADARTAFDQFNRAIQLAPKDASLRAEVGELFQRFQRPKDAEAAFRDALTLSDREPRALAGLAPICLDSGRPQEAETFARRALEVWPENAYVQLVLARALADQQRFQEADAEIEKAIAVNPNDPVAHYLRAGRFRESGKFDEARRDFRRAVEIDPSYAAAYWGYVQCRRATADDRDFVDLMQNALDSKVLDRRGTAEVLFSLGKVYDDLGEFELAMRSFTEGNRMRDQDIVAARPFPKDDYTKLNELVKEILDEPTIRSNRVEEPTTPSPIFVVGMLRSGTTLVEHILSSHPSVAPGGEIRFWTDQLTRSLDLNRRKLNRPQALDARKRYLARLEKLAPAAKFVTDKMPENYRILGLIGAMFPNAKFIHCMRNPVDTCLSIHFTLFHSPPPYAADPDKLVFTYRLYQDLMDHWRQVLPEGSILDVNYADVVFDTEAQTRRILEFCGLPWDDACLQPELNARVVSTASAWQARQPIYTSSLDRWKNYEPWLDGFRALMDA